MTRSVRESFERGTATFNTHDADGFAEVLADDVVFEAPGGIRGKGKGACVQFFGSWFVAFPDAHDDVLHHPMGDIPPTGRPVRISYIQVLRFRDGQHVSFNLMFDRLAMLEQLGVVPAVSRAT